MQVWCGHKVLRKKGLATNARWFPAQMVQQRHNLTTPMQNKTTIKNVQRQKKLQPPKVQKFWFPATFGTPLTIN